MSALIMLILGVTDDVDDDEDLSLLDESLELELDSLELVLEDDDELLDLLLEDDSCDLLEDLYEELDDLCGGEEGIV